jgi:PTS system galactitol-specific IIA component
MKDNLLLDPSLVRVRLTAQDKKDAIHKLSQLLYQHGCVTETFEEAVLAREKTFPTGLPLPIGVALPHTDAEHVRRSALAIGVLDRPITFGEMGSFTGQVEVCIICILAVKQADSVVRVLKELVEAFRERDVLEQIQNASDPETVVNVIEQRIGKNIPISKSVTRLEDR